MISAWHLLWIVPACVSFGLCIAALMTAAGREDHRTDWREELLAETEEEDDDWC